jgi:predicted site-specific integrase-resolvase
MTAREAANKLGITLDAVYRLLWAGKLKGSRNADQDWTVSDEAVTDRLMSKRRVKAKLARRRLKVKNTVVV